VSASHVVLAERPGGFGTLNIGNPDRPFHRPGEVEAANVTGGAGSGVVNLFSGLTPARFPVTMNGRLMVNKFGRGMLELSGSNDYEGITDVREGTLRAGVPHAFSPASAYVVAPGAMLDMGLYDQTVAALD